ncbi:hypothetical protein F9C11_21720 [Amycolatopsis sp. VS8301801F10]|uniref:hypothetical protein n=1 Tax=Amycolatopsis sp. VS8301801F10 TaxID=2652442 RepID=UPI0038FD2C31
MTHIGDPRKGNPMSPKIYRKHNCSAKHRTWRTLAACMWPQAAWISGEGQYATVSRCSESAVRQVVSVALHDDLAKAKEALDLINATACGGRCVKDHELIKLERDTSS